MNKPVRLGVWGCGGHAMNHLEHMPPTDLVDVVALTDLSSDRLQEVSGKLGKNLTVSTDPRNIFPAIDAIFIATPDHCHAEQIDIALRAGKHVLAEKPLAIDHMQLHALKRSMDYASEHGLTFLTCHPRRFDPRNIWMRDNKSRLTAKYGAPVGFTFTFDYPAPRDEWKNDRGLLMDHVNHEVDLMGFILGHDGLTAKRLKDSSRAYEVVGNRDHQDVWFRFAGTRSTAVKDWSVSKETATLCFQRGYVVASGDEPVVREFDSSGIMTDEHDTPMKHHFKRYGEVIGNFAQVICGTARPYVSMWEMFINTLAGVSLTHDGSVATTSDTQKFGPYNW